MTVNTIEPAWSRIAAWLSVHARSELLVAPPASPADLAHLESALGRRLPPELEQWLSVHNGGEFVVWTKNEMSWTFFDTTRIEKDWRALQRLHTALASEFGPDAHTIRSLGPVSSVYWKSAWIPFATNESGDRLCVDMEPEPGGTEGQVILYLRDPAPREVMSPSITALLSQYADGLERGEYELEPFVGIVPVPTSNA